MLKYSHPLSKDEIDALNRRLSVKTESLEQYFKTSPFIKGNLKLEISNTSKAFFTSQYPMLKFIL